MQLLPPTWGDVASVIIFLVTLHLYHTKNVRRFSKLNTRVNIMWNHIKARLNIDDSGDEEA